MLFQPGASFLHRWHPLTKLTFSFCAAVFIFAAPGGFLTAVLAGLTAWLMLGVADQAGFAARLSLRLLAPTALILLIIHGFFNPENQTVVLRAGMFSLGREGLVFAAQISLRLAAFLAASLVLVLTTRPAHLLQALEESGLPRGFSYVLGSPLILLPQVAQRVESIRAAQQARGLETQGSLAQRIRALFPLAAPLIFGTLVDVEERSLALEVRGFGARGHRSHLNRLADSPVQRWARRIMLFSALTASLAALL